MKLLGKFVLRVHVYKLAEWCIFYRRANKNTQESMLYFFASPYVKSWDFLYNLKW